MDVDRVVLGQAVAGLREAAGLTQRDLEGRTSLPTWRLSKLERGSGSEEQRLETLELIAPFLGKTVDEILAYARGEGAATSGSTVAEGELPRIVDLLEQRMVGCLLAPCEGESLTDARTIARLANALENVERARLHRAQRDALVEG